MKGFDDAVQTGMALLGLVGLFTLWRTLVVIAYLPVHLALNRRGVPMQAREEGISWVGFAAKVLVGLIGILVVTVYG